MKKGQKVMVTCTLANCFKAGEIVTCDGKSQAKYIEPNGKPYAHSFINSSGVKQDMSADEYVVIKTPFMRRLYAQLFNK